MKVQGNRYINNPELIKNKVVVQIVGYIKYLLFNDKYKMKCERR